MNYIICFLLWVFSLHPYSNEDNYIFYRHDSTLTQDTLPKGFKELTITLDEYSDLQKKRNTDSLNNWRKGQALPVFLYQWDFDKVYIDCTNGGGMLSMRKKIFRQVINKKVLEEILKKDEVAFILNPPKYVNICLHGITDKYLFWSVKQLARERLKELEHEE